MQKVIFEISYENQIWLEEKCLREGMTFETVLNPLIDSFRNTDHSIKTNPQEEIPVAESAPKKRGRKPKPKD